MAQFKVKMKQDQWFMSFYKGTKHCFVNVEAKTEIKARSMALRQKPKWLVVWIKEVK
jgi:hypothetical protein